MRVAQARADKCIADLTAKEGRAVAACSAVGDGLAERMAANGLHYGTLLEIGTYHGVGAIVLAHFADRVITVDVTPPSDRQALRDIYRWLAPEIAARICQVWVPDNAAKAALVASLAFDMAFIDGGHSELQTALDFRITRKCGTCLFHDYPMSGSGCDGPGIVLDRARDAGDGVVTNDEPFGWWRAAE